MYQHITNPTNFDDKEDSEQLEIFRALIKRGFSADPWARVGGKPSFITTDLNIDFIESDDDKKVKNTNNKKKQCNLLKIQKYLLLML
ncbi:MAG: hypothetical protein HC836_31820 [Richelia sp. RM2_1_2]|nr:hypothetical protein [Richelia sp. RM2_1_2]